MKAQVIKLEPVDPIQKLIEEGELKVHSEYKKTGILFLDDGNDYYIAVPYKGRYMVAKIDRDRRLVRNIKQFMNNHGRLYWMSDQHTFKFKRYSDQDVVPLQSYLYCAYTGERWTHDRGSWVGAVPVPGDNGVYDYTSWNLCKKTTTVETKDNFIYATVGRSTREIIWRNRPYVITRNAVTDSIFNSGVTLYKREEHAQVYWSKRDGCIPLTHMLYPIYTAEATKDNYRRKTVEFSRSLGNSKGHINTVIDHLMKDPHNNTVYNLHVITGAQNKSKGSTMDRLIKRFRGIFHMCAAYMPDSMEYRVAFTYSYPVTITHDGMAIIHKGVIRREACANTIGYSYSTFDDMLKGVIELYNNRWNIRRERLGAGADQEVFELRGYDPFIIDPFIMYVRCKLTQWEEQEYIAQLPSDAFIERKHTE